MNINTNMNKNDPKFMNTNTDTRYVLYCRGGTVFDKSKRKMLN